MSNYVLAVVVVVAAAVAAAVIVDTAIQLAAMD